MLAQYGFVVSGLPLPIANPSGGSAAATKLARKDRSKPFPCMDNACGCDAAERCFTSCCCHTTAETLAWAQVRGIDRAVVDALTRRAAAALPQAAAEGCSPQSTSRSLHSHDDDVDNAICSDYQSLAAEPRDRHDDRAIPDEPARDPAEGDPAGSVVILRAALACGGVAAQWAAIGASLPPPAIVTCELPWPQVGSVSFVDDRVCGAGGPPDLPPPRA
jgi:hypothetical protein